MILYTRREPETILTSVIKEDRKVIHLNRTNVYAIAGTYVETGAEGHGKRSVVRVRAAEIIVLEISLVTNSPKQCMRKWNHARALEKLKTIDPAIAERLASVIVKKQM